MDGSGKCAILRTDSKADVVHGVVFQLAHAEKSALAAAEAVGYQERAIYVRTEVERLQVFTYVGVGSHFERSLKPYEWYKAFVVRGAIEHDLPPRYVERLERVPAIHDPLHTRALQHRRILESSTLEEIETIRDSLGSDLLQKMATGCDLFIDYFGPRGPIGVRDRAHDPVTGSALRKHWRRVGTRQLVGCSSGPLY